MAIITFPSPTQPSGSIDGGVYYKNGGQLAMRSRARPITVKSDPHRQVMSIIGDLSMRWENVLTSFNRIDWGTYAYNSPLTDAYGNPRYVRGYAQFMRSNRPRLQWGLGIAVSGPSTFGFPDFTVPTALFDRGANQVYVTPNNSDDWCSENGATMMLWISRPTKPAANRPPETYMQLGRLQASPGFPPYGSPFVVPYPLPATEFTIWIRSAVSRADGRYTSSESP